MTPRGLTKRGSARGGRRISATELLSRGVDADFLAPVPCIDSSEACPAETSDLPCSEACEKDPVEPGVGVTVNTATIPEQDDVVIQQGRRMRTRAVGRRISVSELRARGVDEDFLAPAHCIEAVQASEKAPESADVAFVSGGIATSLDLDQTIAGIPTNLDIDQAVASSGSQRAARGCAERERAWSTSECQAEYGLGYSILARMGYQGGGRVPLAPVKRVARVALQDNEDLALDRSFPLQKKPRRKKKGAQAAACFPETSAGLGYSADDATAAVEAAFAGHMLGSGVDTNDVEQHSVEANQAEEDANQDEEESDDEDECEHAGLSTAEKRLKLSILAALQRSGGRLPVDELAGQARVQQAMAFRQPSDLGSASLREFVRAKMPQCRLRRSARAGWLKLSGTSSSASWEQMRRRSLVVELVRGRLSSEAAAGMGWDSRSSSEEEADEAPKTPEPQPETPTPLETGDEQDWADGNVPVDSLDDLSVAHPAMSSACHGCGRAFLGRAALREHVAQQLTARTTRDPTDLRNPFDPDHYDREALETAARATASSFSSSSALWHCPVCSQVAPDFSQMLDHAHDAPSKRVEHQRFLSLVAELVLRDPPPRPQTKANTRKAAAVTAWSSPGLASLFNVLTGKAGASSYFSFEEDVLGPQDEDMFACA